MRLLLDTNVYVALMRGESEVASRVRRASEILLSSVVAGELLYGFRHGARYEQNRESLDRFLTNAYTTLVPVTLATAERFGRIAASLRKRGRPLPTNDIWIAAHAMETGADLLSYDRHFDEVEGITLIRVAGA